MPRANTRNPEERPGGARLGGRSAPPQPSPAIGLAQIFGAFFWLGCTSFGGGTAGWLHRDLVLRRRWLDDATFLADLAVAQVVPGSIGVNLVVRVGQRLHGAAGAASALLALLAVPFAVILTISAVYSAFGEHSVLQQMLDGVAAAVIGLTFATGLRSMAYGAPEPIGIAIASATILCVGVLRWPILSVVAALAPLSIALALIRRRG